MNNRNTPSPVVPRNTIESKVEGLRDYSPPPETYNLFRRQPDGSMGFVGEFPTPVVTYGLRHRNHKEEG